MAARLIDFMLIEEPHPYGVFPEGNRFLGGSNSTVASTTHFITANIWGTILSFFDVSTLGKFIQVSRYHYVLGHQVELWRDLVLRKSIEISKVGPSWKDTFQLLSNNDNNVDSRNTYKPHQPIRMEGIYSDDIYRSHLCCSFAIPQAWLHQTTKRANDKVQLVKSVNVNDITPEQFFTQYEEKNQPVVIKQAGDGKACDKWKTWNHLVTQKSNKKLKSYRATSGAAPFPANFTLEAYLDYALSTQYLEESPLYLFDRNAFADNNEWEEDFFPEFYRKCPYWNPNLTHGHDLLQHLGKRKRPDHTWLIIGPKRSGSVFHIDPNATHAWNAVITGRKRWIFYPPGQPPPGIYPTADGDEVTLPLSVGEWIMQYWTEHMEQYRARPAGQRPFECTTYPGDVLFVPHGWWHSVINLDDTNIAITHNYISPSNLGNALKFFVEKQDQISGCRDRKETIKPEHMHNQLVKVLRTKEPRHLMKALEQRSFTCLAWKDNKHGSHAVEKKDLNCNSRSDSSENTNKKRRIITEPERVSNFTFSFL